MTAWIRLGILAIIVGAFLGIVHHDCATAAGSVSTPVKAIYTVLNQPSRATLTLTWTGDASNGSVPNTDINLATYGLEGWYLYQIETDPGSQAPTSLYDIAITDSRGVDVTWGLVANRSETATELVSLETSSYSLPLVTGTLTLAISNNSVASATGVIILKFIATR